MTGTSGGIYWFYVDIPFVSTHVPVYAGVQDVSAYYKCYDIRSFSEDSARWAVDFVEMLLLLRWQEAAKDLEAARAPLENEFFDSQASVDEKAKELLAGDPPGAKKYLTDLTIDRMDRFVKMYKSLRNQLIAKYSGDPYRPRGEGVLKRPPRRSSPGVPTKNSPGGGSRSAFRNLRFDERVRVHWQDKGVGRRGGGCGFRALTPPTSCRSTTSSVDSPEPRANAAGNLTDISLCCN